LNDDGDDDGDGDEGFLTYALISTVCSRERGRKRGGAHYIKLLDSTRNNFFF
jgi:hypothetical protein